MNRFKADNSAALAVVAESLLSSARLMTDCAERGDLEGAGLILRRLQGACERALPQLAQIVAIQTLTRAIETIPSPPTEPHIPVAVRN